jgi:TetR/AcrR family transcriptional repressor of nem operon
MKKNIGRPKAFDESEALECAMHYFWEHGYDKSSLSDLLKAMNIQKSSFYQTFKNKEHIFRLSLELYQTMTMKYLQDMRKELGEKGVLLHLVYITMNDFKETGKTKGCLLMKSGSECYVSHPHFTELINYEFKSFQNIFKEFIEIAQIKGDIKNDKSPFVLGSIYQSLINGLVQMIQVGAKDKELEAVVKHIEELLE